MALPLVAPLQHGGDVLAKRAGIGIQVQQHASQALARLGVVACQIG